MPSFLAPVPMDDALLWAVGIGFVVFAVNLNVMALHRSERETAESARFGSGGCAFVVLVCVAGLFVLSLIDAYAPTQIVQVFAWLH